MSRGRMTSGRGSTGVVRVAPSPLPDSTGLADEYNSHDRSKITQQVHVALESETIKRTAQLSKYGKLIAMSHWGNMQKTDGFPRPGARNLKNVSS